MKLIDDDDDDADDDFMRKDTELMVG